MVASVCIRLGFWQLDRLSQRRERNAALARAMEAPALSLTPDSLRAVAENPERFLYRRVAVQGEYDFRGTALLRGRARRGTPGVHLVTPLRIDGSEAALLIDRGWVPSPDATTVDPRRFRQPGEVALVGYLQLLPSASAGEARPLRIELDGYSVPTFQRLDRIAYRETYPDSLLPFYLERVDEGDAAPTPPVGASPPVLDEGPHLGYAIQWFSFAAIGVIGFLIMVRRSRTTS